MLLFVLLFYVLLLVTSPSRDFKMRNKNELLSFLEGGVYHFATWVALIFPRACESLTPFLKNGRLSCRASYLGPTCNWAVGVCIELMTSFRVNQSQ